MPVLREPLGCLFRCCCVFKGKLSVRTDWNHWLQIYSFAYAAWWTRSLFPSLTA